MDGQTKPFASVLQEARRGLLHGELSDALAEVAQAVTEHGKEGSLTLTLKLKPSGDSAVELFADVKVKAPEEKKAPSLFFTDEAGNLSRTDPRQQEMEGLRDVSGAEDEQPRDAVAAVGDGA